MANVTNSTLYQLTSNKFANGSAATSETRAYTINNLSGSMLGCVVWWNGSGITCSVSDSQGNVWTSRPALNPGGGAIHTQFFYASNSKPGANTITYSFSGAGATFIEVLQLEWTGVDTIDASASGQTSGTSSTPTAPTVTTSQPSELVFAYAGLSAGDNSSWATPTYPLTLLMVPGGGEAFNAVDLHNAAVGSYSLGFSISASQAWAAGVVGFYAASPSAPILNQSDSFQRADENPLSNGGTWTTPTGTASLEVISNKVTNATTNANGNSEFWNAAIFPDDQFSQATVAAIDAVHTNTDLGALARTSAYLNDSFYFASLYGANSNPLGGSQQIFLSKVSAGGETVLAVTNQIANVGDVVRIDARGPVLLYKLNGRIVLVGVDTSYISGFAGLHCFNGSVVNVDKISAWSGGALAPAVLASASDNFSQANGLLNSNWIQAANTINASSGSATGNSNGAVNAAIYSGIEFIANQQAQATVTSLNSSDFVGVTVRSSGTTLSSANPSVGYAAYDLVENTTTISLRKTTITTAGAVTSTVLATASVSGAVGDVLKLVASGTLLTGFRNGVQVLTANDSSIIAGFPGIELFSNAASLGSFSASSAGASSAYSVPDCRVSPFGPNASRVVQGTSIYDVQTSSNRSIPPTDSRTAGAPVDSRAPGLAPQNSRTPGTYGPGVN